MIYNHKNFPVCIYCKYWDKLMNWKGYCMYHETRTDIDDSCNNFKHYKNEQRKTRNNHTNDNVRKN